MKEKALSKDNILIIQGQRLGDLVLTFPLFYYLYQEDRSIHVVAEKSFYDALLPIAPKVTFFPLDSVDVLKSFNYTQIINLSNRPETLKITRLLKDSCSNFIGMYKSDDNDDTVRIAGAWQLYRHSLILNNHYNTFHWADINALDAVPFADIRKKTSAKPIHKNTRRIGLFVGASDKSKRPTPEFWADLATDLSRRGYSPIFLGGSGEEKEIGQKAVNLTKMPVINMCGRFTIKELLIFMRTLDLLVCPDTGPMHVASFGQTLCFNLSLGPVSAWETGPRPSGHYILRSNLPCAPCWECYKEEQECRNYFVANRIGNLIHSILREKTLPNIPGLELCKSASTHDGLYTLENLERNPSNTLRMFWHQFFLYILQNTTATIDIKVNDFNQIPEPLWLAAQDLKKNAKQIYLELHISNNLLEKNMNNMSVSREFWMDRSAYLLPLTSFCWTLAENYDLSNNVIASIHSYIQLLHKILK